MPSVLLVCTANLCRSPMATVMLKQKLQQIPGVAGWRVESAGTWAEENKPAIYMARNAMAARGLDLESHRSRMVTRDLLRQFNLILTMERGQKEALQIEFPAIAPRVYLLSEMVNTVKDVLDPDRPSSEEFEQLVNELDDLLTRGLGTILGLAVRTGPLPRSPIPSDGFDDPRAA